MYLKCPEGVSTEPFFLLLVRVAFSVGPIFLFSFIFMVHCLIHLHLYKYCRIVIMSNIIWVLFGATKGMNHKGKALLAFILTEYPSDTKSVFQNTCLLNLVINCLYRRHITMTKNFCRQLFDITRFILNYIEMVFTVQNMKYIKDKHSYVPKL